MDLVLWRHAEAEVSKPGTPDIRRCLTGRGEQQAREIAAWIRAQPMRDLRVFSSPANRCTQTADMLALPYETDRRLGVGATAADLLGVIAWPDYHGTVIVVGHQPALGRIASLLLAGDESDWTIKRGGIWWFSNRTRKGETQTVLKAVINPLHGSAKKQGAALPPGAGEGSAPVAARVMVA